MARIRSVKHEMPSDATLASVSRDARLTFVYLITQSDDYGLVPGAPRQLLGLLFPHDDDVTPESLDGWVSELVFAGLVCRRKMTDGAAVLQLIKWGKHQRIDNRSRSTMNDKLDESQVVDTEQVGGSATTSRNNSADFGRNPPSRVPSPSPTPTPTPRGKSSREIVLVDGEFDAAWDAYPKRPGNARKAALVAYTARRRDGVTAETLLDAVKAYAAHCARDGTAPRFVMLGSTFFGPNERWSADFGAVEADPLAGAPPDVRACVNPDGTIALWRDFPGGTEPTAAMKWLMGDAA